MCARLPGRDHTGVDQVGVDVLPRLNHRADLRYLRCRTMCASILAGLGHITAAACAWRPLLLKNKLFEGDTLQSFACLAHPARAPAPQQLGCSQ